LLALDEGGYNKGDRVLAEASPKEKQSLLSKKVSNYCQVLRHSVRGEYRDRGGVLARFEEFRIHSSLQRSFKQLLDGVLQLRPVGTNSLKAAMFDLLEEEMIAQRGRELPGFINTQVFYSYIIDLVEEWRPIVEDCKSEIVEHFQLVSNSLSAEIIKDFPHLCSAIQGITSKLIETAADELGSKLEALLTREQDPFTAQDVLLEVVNGIRSRTFDAILRQTLDTTDIKQIGNDVYSMKQDIRTRLGN
jgi:hypothetical protein